jgi:hypothetical protein
MERRKISAREAVADIRSGTDDTTLMKKYGLSPDGLQSLFDKLVKTGFIDLAEMQNRVTGFLGTVVISEADLQLKDRTDEHAVRSKSVRTLNAQEVARDVRSGMNDSGLMGKYRLSPKGLAHLLRKLTSLGLLTDADFERRRLGHDDNTIDLREDKLSLSDALMKLGIDRSNASPIEIESVPKETIVDNDADGNGEMGSLSTVHPQDRPVPEVRPSARESDNLWYDRPIILILVLLGLFPLGIYGIFRTNKLSVGIKACIIVGWTAIVVVLSLILYLSE